MEILKTFKLFVCRSRSKNCRCVADMENELAIAVSKICNESTTCGDSVVLDDVGAIKVIGGTSKAGRKFITCTVE